MTPSFSKAPFSKCFPSTLKLKTSVFKIPPSTVSKKLCFRDGLVSTVGLTVEIKLHFQIPPAQYVVQTGPKYIFMAISIS